MIGSDIPMAAPGRAELVRALSMAADLPVEAMDWAAQAPDRIAPDVLAALERAARGEGLAPGEGNLVFWGVHVLAEARDGRSFAPLLAMVRRSPDEWGEVLGEAFNETMAMVFASLFDPASEDAARLEQAIADTAADGFVRWSLFGAYAFLAFDGAIARDRARGFLERFDAQRAVPAGDPAWIGWEQAIALLGLADLRPAVEAARAEARLVTTDEEATLVASLFAAAEAGPDDPARFVEMRLGYVDDAILLLDAVLGAGEDGEPAGPVLNPFRDVGRNDPCPCGSGRKFKKCCLEVA